MVGEGVEQGLEIQPWLNNTSASQVHTIWLKSSG